MARFFYNCFNLKNVFISSKTNPHKIVRQNVATPNKEINRY